MAMSGQVSIGMCIDYRIEHSLLMSAANDSGTVTRPKSMESFRLNYSRGSLRTRGRVRNY